jgi:general stress protein 26
MADDRVAKLRELVKDIEVAMMTTRRADGHLVSRPMAVQAQAPGADFWFVAERGSGKLHELEHDPHVNLAFYKDGSREWVSVSGMATPSEDRETIRRLHRPDWRVWFGDEGGAHDGSPEDPRMVLIGVHAQEAVFLELGKPRPMVLFEMAKSVLTGAPAELGRTEQVSGDELRATKPEAKGR